MSSSAQADAAHFQPDGGINDAHLVNQLAGNGQSIDSLAFITSVPGGNLELLGRGGAGTFVSSTTWTAAGASVPASPSRPVRMIPSSPSLPRPTAARRWIWKTTT